MCALDPQSEFSLRLLSERQKIQQNKIAGVRSVLVVLSGRALSFDPDSIRYQIELAYPGSTVSFCTPLGKPLNGRLPPSADLLIDLTAPTDRHKLFFAKKIRRLSRVAVGRNAGVFRRKLYDRVFDEKNLITPLTVEDIDRERAIQKEIFALAGVPVCAQGGPTPNTESTIALKLPYG